MRRSSSLSLLSPRGLLVALAYGCPLQLALMVQVIAEASPPSVSTTTFAHEDYTVQIQLANGSIQ